MGFDYSQLKKGDLSAVEIAIKLEGQKETGNNSGAIVRYATGGTDNLQWCAAFATQVMIDGNQGQWLTGASRFSAPDVMNHGQKLGLNSKISDNPPDIGSIVSKSDSEGVYHIAIITEVERDNAGNPTHFTVTNGNFSNAVVSEIVTAKELKLEFDNKYVDSRKIDQYNAKNYPTARLFIEPPETQLAAPEVAPVNHNLIKIQETLRVNGVTNQQPLTEPSQFNLAAPINPFPTNSPNARQL